MMLQDLEVEKLPAEAFQDGEAAQFSVNAAFPLALDLEPLGGKGEIEGYFVSVSKHSAQSKAVLFHARVTLAGSCATQTNAQIAGIGAATLGTQSSTGETVNGGILPSIDETLSNDDQPLATRDGHAIWLLSLDDLRLDNQGVRVALNLRTHEPHAGYLFVHLLTATPQVTLSTAVHIARKLWLADAPSGNWLDGPLFPG